VRSSTRSMSATSRAVTYVGSVGRVRVSVCARLRPCGAPSLADWGSLTGACVAGRAVVVLRAPRSAVSRRGSRSGSKVAEASRGGLRPPAPGTDHCCHGGQPLRREDGPHLRVPGLVPPDARNRPDPREQPRPVRVDGQVDTVEPLDLPIAAGDHGKAFDVEPNAQAMRSDQRAELLDGTLFEGRLSARCLLGHRWPSGRRAESEEHARRVDGGGPRSSAHQVGDTVQLIRRRRRERGAAIDAKRRAAMEFASPGSLVGWARRTSRPSPIGDRWRAECDSEPSRR